MPKNILILSGSPRKNGSTDLLVKAFCEGAAEAGHHIIVHRVADMNINGCLGCKYCSKKIGECAQKDDMTPVYDEIRAADVVVFASPIYCASISGQLKLALDRTFVFYWEGIAGKESVLLLTCGEKFIEMADTTIAMFHHTLSDKSWTEASILVVTGLDEPEEIMGRPELDKARNLGRNI